MTADAALAESSLGPFIEPFRQATVRPLFEEVFERMLCGIKADDGASFCTLQLPRRSHIGVRVLVKADDLNLDEGL